MADALARMEGAEVVSLSAKDEAGEIAAQRRNQFDVYIANGFEAARTMSATCGLDKGVRVFIPTNDHRWFASNVRAAKLAKWDLILPEQPCMKRRYDKYCRVREWLPYACEPSVFYPDAKLPVAYDVGFGGSLGRAVYAKRARWLKDTAAAGYTVLKNSNAASHDEIRAIISRSKVAFHMSYEFGLGCKPMGVAYRVFEVLGCGGVLLCDRDADVARLFTPNLHYLDYATWDEYLEQLNRATHDQILRDRIGAEARKIILDKHTWDHRAQRLVELVRGM